jgi:polar amino acid transport system substrate-binding protein
MKIKSATWKVANQDVLLKDLGTGAFDAVFDARLPSGSSAHIDQSAPVYGGLARPRPGGPSTQAGLKERSIMTTDHPYFNYIRNLPFEKKVNVSRPDAGLLGFCRVRWTYVAVRPVRCPHRSGARKRTKDTDNFLSR